MTMSTSEENCHLVRRDVTCEDGLDALLAGELQELLDVGVDAVLQ
jgi:hypothetical protein